MNSLFKVITLLLLSLVLQASAHAQSGTKSPSPKNWTAEKAKEFLEAKGADKEAMAAFLELKCVQCHAPVEERDDKPHHGRGKCETCHTNGMDHRQALLKGESGKGSIVFPKTAECASCHKLEKKLMNWHFSVHSKAGTECRECHTIHRSTVARSPNPAFARMDRDSTMCLNCHQDVGASLSMRSHHPVKEGGLSCVSCHDPHGGKQAVLRGKNDTCLSCHQSLRGPMVFEHAPVADDCLSCHTPHGSPNRRLMAVSQPAVCLQCHSIAQGKHGYGTGPEPSPTAGTKTISGAVLRGCTNCHSAIHGSHQDPVLRR